MAGASTSTTTATKATTTTATATKQTYGTSQTNVYNNANAYINSEASKTIGATKTVKRTGNMTFKNGKSNLEDFFIGKDASSANTKIEKQLNKIISDLDAIKKSYKKLADHKSTTGDFKEGAQSGVDAAKGYHTSAETVAKKMDDYMKQSCAEYVEAFQKGSLKLKQDAGSIGKGVSNNL